jgi:hypothetical protein
VTVTGEVAHAHPEAGGGGVSEEVHRPGLSHQARREPGIARHARGDRGVQGERPHPRRSGGARGASHSANGGQPGRRPGRGLPPAVLNGHGMPATRRHANRTGISLSLGSSDRPTGATRGGRLTGRRRYLSQ